MAGTVRAVPSEKWWTLTVTLLVALAVCSPLIFGLPVLGLYTANDANFALQLVQGYMSSLNAHQWFPRWLAEGNGGLGSPVFYYYGRLPFLVSAALAVGLHVSASAGLLLGIAAFRLLAFFTCRAWLLQNAGRVASDCGALLFIALPFAMSYNTTGRLGYAEAAATAFIPLLLLVLQRESRGRVWSWNASLLVLVYGALAATHLPQTLLAFGAGALYAAMVRGVRGVTVNLVGFAGGLILSAPSILPALSMQNLITPRAWTLGAAVDVRSQFLFTLARLHVYHFLGQELYLYGSWILCLACLLPFILDESMRQEWRDRRSAAILVSLLVCLAAMTKLFWPLWVWVSPLRALQFPWRLFPAAMAFAGGAVAVAVQRERARRRWYVLGIGCLIALQGAVHAAGAFVSISHSRFARIIPYVIVIRLPSYVPWSQRESLANMTERRIVPEYIPAAAREAGWHLDEEQKRFMKDGPLPFRRVSQGVAPLFPASEGIQLSRTTSGAIDVRGSLTAPQSLLLPSFFFPDEQVLGRPTSASLGLDTPTGLSLLQLPAGPVTLRVSHTGIVPAVRKAREASFAGLASFLVLAVLGRWRSRVRENSRIVTPTY